MPSRVWLLSGAAILSIWVGVALAMFFAPDMVTGSQHEHLALVGGTEWIWGLVGTSFVILAAQKGIKLQAYSLGPWLVLAVGAAISWIPVVLVTAFAPSMVTGTDPTIIPLSAMGIPIVGAFLTWFACALARTGFEQEAGGFDDGG